MGVECQQRDPIERAMPRMRDPANMTHPLVLRARAALASEDCELLDLMSLIEACANEIESMDIELKEMIARAVCLFHYLPDNLNVGDVQKIKNEYSAWRSSISLSNNETL